MRQPITFIYRNLVFGERSDDIWAVYRLPMRSYAGLSVAAKRDLLALLAGLARGLEADFSLLRVARPWDFEHYSLGVLAQSDLCHVRRKPLDRYLERQRDALSDGAYHTPEAFLSVRLDAAQAVSPHPFAGVSSLRALRRALGRGDGRAVSSWRLAVLVAEEDRVAQRIREYVGAAPAATHELQWLIRRAFTRGLGDPLVDERFLPQALVIDGTVGDGGFGYVPLEADILRLFDSPINVAARQLRVETEMGDSHQAFLCVGALPEVVQFPGREAELLFAPLEALEFPVDAVFSAHFVPGAEAARLVRRRVVDLGVGDGETIHVDQGRELADSRMPELRELEQRLLQGNRPSLLRATVSLALGAPTAAELEDRVERLRGEYESVKLHRPLGEQLGLFVAHLPGQLVPVADYDDYLGAEQFGAMVPIATNSVGTDTGPCIGYTLSGGRRPVLFDPSEASRTGSSPGTLLLGSPGTGRALCMKLILYQAFLAGAIICNIDTSGDSALDHLPGVAAHLEVIELSGEERCQGILDPLLIAPEDSREDLACSFLMSILADPVPLGWETEIRHAVRRVLATDGHSCSEVVEELRYGSSDARVVARALSIRSRFGLARLGFAEPGASVLDAEGRQVTTLRTGGRPLCLAGARGRDLTDEERLDRSILHLLVAYALRLTGRDQTRHALLACDEATVLLSGAPGRALVENLTEVGRARKVTPLLAAGVSEDLDALGTIIGAVFCFGVETQQQASAALRLLRQDDSDPAVRECLVQSGYGRCLMRDHAGRVSPIQIDAFDPELLADLEPKPCRGADPRICPDERTIEAVPELDHVRK